MQLRIKEVSKSQGISITKLAELVGITQPNMSNIANGKTSPSLELLDRIATALGVTVPELFAPQPTNTITCPHCGAVLEIREKE
ncbi:MAG TPA: helix-turn-helix domain-containing protein [Candidatus Alistipes intestinigallinarum]|uniref:Helix-turn-helix domain-containing protein n=1 Tax=Candidatus Alistipes intestinigallinarum TaxID=2838440 RepID=A0A9D1YXU1_9BACT|nr:helix-turn-helix domain-containing protein [Candidatus Alistipes intestinigallinarum]